MFWKRGVGCFYSNIDRDTFTNTYTNTYTNIYTNTLGGRVAAGKSLKRRTEIKIIIVVLHTCAQIQIHIQIQIQIESRQTTVAIHLQVCPTNMNRNLNTNTTTNMVMGMAMAMSMVMVFNVAMFLMSVLMTVSVRFPTCTIRPLCLCCTGWCGCRVCRRPLILLVPAFGRQSRKHHYCWGFFLISSKV